MVLVWEIKRGQIVSGQVLYVKDIIYCNQNEQDYWENVTKDLASFNRQLENANKQNDTTEYNIEKR